MKVSELQHYPNWYMKTPLQIIKAVQDVGGWANVFPHSLPRWASKVRNFFNVLPTKLKRLPDKNARDLLKRYETFKFQLECYETQSANQRYVNESKVPVGTAVRVPYRVPAGCPKEASHDVKHTGLIDSLGVKNALSGQAYTDEYGRPWLQMAAGSTIYHWGREPYNKYTAIVEALYVDKVRGQNDTPVIKLISMDTTGGSNEVILINDGSNAYAFGQGSEEVGKVGECWDVSKIILTDPAYQGSYNFSETSQVGFAAHQKRDIDPHVPGRHFYVNPRDMHAPLGIRRFPIHDMQGQVLAGQK